MLLLCCVRGDNKFHPTLDTLAESLDQGFRNFVLVVIYFAFVCCDLFEQKSIINSTAAGTSSKDGNQIDGTVAAAAAAAIAIAATGFYLRRSVGVFRLFCHVKIQ